MKANIITIGDEILIGQTIDTNSAWISAQLEDIGYKVIEILSIADKKDAIKEALGRSQDRADLVLITGGLGPTKDDITKDALADYFSCDMKYNAKMYEMITDYFRSRNRPITELHRQQCYLPSAAKLLRNNLGTAPGMLFTSGQTTYISMPGVPYEMQYIMTHGVLPLLRQEGELQEEYYLKKTIRTAGEGESIISERIAYIVDQLPSYMSMAYLPGTAQVRLRLSGAHHDIDELQGTINKYADMISAELGELVFGYDDISLSEALGKLCQTKNLSIATAESCTGGKVAGEIVRIPGSSGYFNGGIVSYSNEMKRDILRVSQDSLNEYGAVSQSVVEQMVKGAIELCKSDLAVAISGVAGPGGGSAEKPVGTVWIAVGNSDKVIAQRHQLRRDRERNINYSVSLALNAMRLFIQSEH